MVKAEPNRWAVVDAGQKWESVQEGLRRVIVGRLEIDGINRTLTPLNKQEKDELRRIQRKSSKSLKNNEW